MADRDLYENFDPCGEAADTLYHVVHLVNGEANFPIEMSLTTSAPDAATGERTDATWYDFSANQKHPFVRGNANFQHRSRLCFYRGQHNAVLLMMSQEDKKLKMFILTPERAHAAQQTQDPLQRHVMIAQELASVGILDPKRWYLGREEPITKDDMPTGRVQYEIGDPVIGQPADQRSFFEVVIDDLGLDPRERAVVLDTLNEYGNQAKDYRRSLAVQRAVKNDFPAPAPGENYKPKG